MGIQDHEEGHDGSLAAVVKIVKSVGDRIVLLVRDSRIGFVADVAGESSTDGLIDQLEAASLEKTIEETSRETPLTTSETPSDASDLTPAEKDDIDLTPAEKAEETTSNNYLEVESTTREEGIPVRDIGSLSLHGTRRELILLTNPTFFNVFLLSPSLLVSHLPLLFLPLSHFPLLY